jgi:transposase
MEHDPLKGDTCVFISGSRRAAKVLIFDGTGLLLLHKKLEVGLFMRVSKSQNIYELSPKALEQILGSSNVLLGSSLVPK